MLLEIFQSIVGALNIESDNIVSSIFYKNNDCLLYVLNTWPGPNQLAIILDIAYISGTL